MEITSAGKKFVDEFIRTKGVYGVDYYKCDCCNGWCIRVVMNTNDKELMSKIPDMYEGYCVDKVLGTQDVAQKINPSPIIPKSNHIAKEFIDKYLFGQKLIYGAAANQIDNTLDVLINTNNKNIMAMVPDTYKGIKINKIHSEPIKAQTENKTNRIKITPKGQMYWQKAPITGGYIPEDIFILLLIKDGKSYDLDYLKKSKRKLQNWDGLITYLFTKGLISIDGATSPQAEDYSNVRGGGRRGGFSRGRGASRVVRPNKHVRYVRRNYATYYGYPYYPQAAYYVNDDSNENNPEKKKSIKIKITSRGIDFIKKNKSGVYNYFLTSINNGLIFDESALRSSLKLKDFNNILKQLYINKLVEISK